MADSTDPDRKSSDQPDSNKVVTPKRGAIPTPKSEIEKARPYIPDEAPENKNEGDTG